MIMLLAVGAIGVALLLFSMVAPSAANNVIIAVLRRVAGFRVGSIADGGNQWRYLERGQPDGEVVLLIHGFGADKDTWLGYGRLFDRSYRVVCPDLPGFGDATDWQVSDYAPREQAQRVLAFMERLNLSRAHLAGSSMGGYIAVWMALLAPERFDSLTLMNAAGVTGETPSKMQPMVEAGGSPLVAQTPDELNEILSMLSTKPMPLPGFVKRHLLSRYTSHGDLWRKVFDQLVHAQQTDRLVDRLAEIDVKTLVVWGMNDEILDVSCADTFHASIQGSRILKLDSVGHIPMFESPHATLAAQLDLIRETTSDS